MRSSLSFLLLIFGSVQAFTAVSRSSLACCSKLAASSQENEFSRRNVIGAIFAAASTSILVSRPAFADVSDGNVLPQGAAQFARLIKVKTDLAVITKRVSQKSDEIEKKEWDNIGQFLRRLYSAGDDMKAVASGLYDPDKKKKATEAIQLLQKYAKAGEGPVNKQDGPTFVAIMNKCSSLIDDFFELLRDIPDEI